MKFLPFLAAVALTACADRAADMTPPPALNGDDVTLHPTCVKAPQTRGCIEVGYPVPNGQPIP